MDEVGAPSIRRPGGVPDDRGADGHGVAGGFDTDGDGRLDTVFVGDGADLLVQTDLDADGLVDRVLRIGEDGLVRTEPTVGPDEVLGSAPATWPGLLGRLLGPDP